MDWIMQPLSGFADLADPNLGAATCEGPAILTISCHCSGGLACAPPGTLSS